MGSSLCRTCFSPCTLRYELVPWTISIVDVDVDKQSCGVRALLGPIILLKITMPLTWLLDAMGGLD